MGTVLIVSLTGLSALSLLAGAVSRDDVLCRPAALGTR